MLSEKLSVGPKDEKEPVSSSLYLLAGLEKNGVL